MAYSTTGTIAPVQAQDNTGRTYYTWTVVETDAGAATEYNLEGAPSVGTITNVDTALHASESSATTGQIEFGTVSGWTSGGTGHIDQATSAGDPIKLSDNKRYLQTSGKVYVRSVLDATASHTLTTVITIAEGHI